MADSDDRSVIANIAIVIWGVAALLLVTIGSAVVLAMTADEPNWAEIVLAISTVGLTLATIALAVAAFMALGGLEESRRDRNAVAMTDMSLRWDNEHFRNVRWLIQEISGSDANCGIRLKDKIIELRDGNKKEYRELLTEPSFLEDLAISITSGGISFEIVRDSLGYIVWDRWCLWQPTVAELRIVRRERTVFEHFERLAERMKRELPGLPDFDKWTGPRY